MKKKSAPEVEIVNPNDVPAELIAEAIVTISEAMGRINNTRLTRRAIVALIHDYSKICKRDIEIVLNNLDALEEKWLKKRL